MSTTLAALLENAKTWPKPLTYAERLRLQAVCNLPWAAIKDMTDDELIAQVEAQVNAWKVDLVTKRLTA